MSLNTNPFGDLLKALWQERGLHQAEFCRRVGAPAGWVQQIREAKKSPPLDRMPQWADVLELTAARRRLFLDMAAVMHLPEHQDLDGTLRVRFALWATQAARATGRSA